MANPFAKVNKTLEDAQKKRISQELGTNDPDTINREYERRRSEGKKKRADERKAKEDETRGRMRDSIGRTLKRMMGYD